MDKLSQYREILRDTIKRHARFTPSHGVIESLPICDVEGDQYLLMDVGWDATGRVHAVSLHLRLRDGKVWIEWDGTEPGIAVELIEAGIPESDIVAAFQRLQDPSSLTLAVQGKA